MKKISWQTGRAKALICFYKRKRMTNPTVIITWSNSTRSRKSDSTPAVTATSPWYSVTELVEGLPPLWVISSQRLTVLCSLAWTLLSYRWRLKALSTVAQKIIRSRAIVTRKRTLTRRKKNAVTSISIQSYFWKRTLNRLIQKHSRKAPWFISLLNVTAMPYY